MQKNQYGTRLYKIVSKNRDIGESDLHLAQRLGISKSSLHGWREGQCPKLDAITDVARKLSIPVKDVLMDILLDSERNVKAKPAPPERSA